MLHPSLFVQCQSRDVDFCLCFKTKQDSVWEWGFDAREQFSDAAVEGFLLAGMAVGGGEVINVSVINPTVMCEHCTPGLLC